MALRQIGKSLRQMNARANGAVFHERIEHLAKQYGGTFTSRSGTFLRRPARAEFPIGEAVIKMGRDGHGDSIVTSIAAPFVMGAGPVFTMEREGVVSGIKKGVGVREARFPMLAEFDLAFYFRTPDPSGSKSLWTEDLQKHALTLYSKNSSWLKPSPQVFSINTAKLRSTGRKVELSYVVNQATEDDPQGLERGAQLVAAVAQYGTAWFRRVRDLPNARYAPPQGPFDKRSVPQVVLRLGQGQVWFMPLVMNGSLAVAASVHLLRPLQRLALNLTADAIDDADLPPNLWSTHDRPLLLAALPGRLEIVERAARFVLVGNPDSSRLMAAARLLVALSRGPSGAAGFR